MSDSTASNTSLVATETHAPSRRSQLRYIKLSIDDLKAIFERLRSEVIDEGGRLAAQLSRLPDKSEDDFKTEVADLRVRAFRVTVTIAGDYGDSIFGDDVRIFESPHKPDRISQVYMTNVTAFENATGRKPPNSFELLLDFRKPLLLDPGTVLSAPTSNGSNLAIDGTTTSWVAAVHEAMDGVVRRRKIARHWIHRGFSYDVGLTFLAMPTAFALCGRLSDLINQAPHPVVAGAGYIYCFFLALWAYRALFGYTKWAFPALELVDNKDNSGRHQVFWATIMLGLAGNVIWETVTWIAQMLA